MTVHRDQPAQGGTVISVMSSDPPALSVQPVIVTDGQSSADVVVTVGVAGDDVATTA